MRTGWKHSLIIAVLVLLFAAALPAAEKISGNCALFIKASNIKEMAGQIASYAAFAGGRLTGDQILNNISRKMFGRDAFPGIDLSRPVRMYFYKLPAPSRFQRRPHILMVFPLSDRGLFEQTAAPRMRRSGSTIAYRGGFAYVASTSKAYAEFRKGRALRGIRLVGDTQMSMYMNTRLFKREIQGSLHKVWRVGGPMGGFTRAFLRIYMKMLQDTRYMGFGGSLDRDGLEMGFSMGFVPGSAISSVFSGSRADRLRALSILPADSIAAAAGKSPVGKWSRYFSKLIAPLKRRFPSLGKIVDELFTYLRENSTGESAVAMLPAPGQGFSFAAVSGVRSASSSRSFYRKMAGMVNSLNVIRKLKARGTRVKLVYSRGLTSIAGKRVDECKLTFSFYKPVPAHAAVLVNMLRRLFTAKIVYTGGYELVAVGDNASRRLREMLRNTSGDGDGFKSSAAYRMINRRYGKYAKNSLFYLSMKGFVKEIMEVAIPMSGQMAPVLRRIRIPGSFYGYSYSTGRGIRMRMLLDREAIMGMMNLAQFFMVSKKPPRRYRRKYR